MNSFERAIELATLERIHDRKNSKVTNKKEGVVDFALDWIFSLGRALEGTEKILSQLFTSKEIKLTKKSGHYSKFLRKRQ